MFSLSVRRILPFAWGGIIIFLSLLPGGRGGLHLFGIPHFDKVGHFGMYAIWSFLICQALLSDSDKNSSRAVWVSFIITAFIGILLEYGQNTVTSGRSFEVADMIANAGGGLVGSLAALVLQKRR